MVVGEEADHRRVLSLRLLQRNHALACPDERVPPEPALLDRLEQEGRLALAPQPDVSPEWGDQVGGGVGGRGRHRLQRSASRRRRHPLPWGYIGAMARSVIVSAVRTPFAKLGGGLADREATELGAIAIRAALDRVDVKDDEVEYVIMGQVLQGGAGQAPARQAAVGAGLPIGVPADTINKVCASSVRAVQIADLMIRSGDHSVVVAGGMESMSNAPYILKKARFGYRLGDGALIDLMYHVGLNWCVDH